MLENHYSSFRFEKYAFDEADKTLHLSYSLDEKVLFEESIAFGFDYAESIDRVALDSAFFGLFVMAGISYAKTCLPPEIVFATGGLDERQKVFFDKIYANGLGQFAFENDLDPKSLPAFPATLDTREPAATIEGLVGSMVAFGGGKDSITTCEILKKSGEAFETWNVGDYPFFGPAIKEVGMEHHRIIRRISPQLFELNRHGAYNGHVPITAVNSFIGICAAILRGKRNVIFSNESSSREGNAEYKGVTVNHQYSKTLEFERDFQNYIRDFISPSLCYFSFLRPLSELKVAEIFCNDLFGNYHGKFSSCNRNFTQANSHTDLAWCGACAKCASIFALFSPFMKKEELLGIFGGKDLFADPLLNTAYEGLLGISGIKPFDCVGEILETRMAITMAQETGHWPSLAKFVFEKPHFDYAAFEEHAMPEEFAALLTNFLAHRT